MVVPSGCRPLVGLRQHSTSPLSNIHTAATFSDSVQSVEPAWVGAQGTRERRLWSTVLRPAAVELAKHAAEISEAVAVYTRERLPVLLDNAEALGSSTRVSINGVAIFKISDG